MWDLLREKMKKKPVNKQINILDGFSRKTKDPKCTQIYDEYRHTKTGMRVETTREWATKTGQDLLEYCKHHDSLRIPPFHFSLGMGPITWERLVKEYPELQEALVEAKDILGDRRLKLGLEKKYEANLVTFVQHQYHPDWKAAEEYHDARKTQIALASEGNPGNTEIHVHMDQIPDSGIVPNKKKESNE